MLLGVCLDLRNTIKHGALKIELHQHAQSLRKAGVHANWEIQGTDSPMLNKPTKRRQGLAKLIVGILCGIVTLLLRTEDPLNLRVVIEEREEDGDTLDNGGAEFRLDSFPIVMEPALDGFELRKLFGICLGRVKDRASLRLN